MTDWINSHAGLVVLGFVIVVMMIIVLFDWAFAALVVWGFSPTPAK